ncbi:hypothetical protein [Dyadobacter psychrotolerans]|uniref:Uncharacterized protein n=1 Tax=Dyadobacter psychrotolerans TaxID=2541721 RepID=A0A4V2Z2U5_9BACT|nr:hypothetical protein [Dyadobacter psychrotolerans]TDE10198.1 hypothetical protein E0F88_28290 [Dyadobacter psychrotolerans]
MKNKFVLEFEQTQNAYNNDKFVYNAWFKVKASKVGEDITLDIYVERRDVAGHIIKYIYPFVKKL